MIPLLLSIQLPFWWNLQPIVPEYHLGVSKDQGMQDKKHGFGTGFF